MGLTMLAVAIPEALAGDPTRVYRTIESDHFVIHYDEPLGDVARRLAVVAEAAHRTLTPALDHRPAEKTTLIVVDDTDGANGFASVIPRNTITAFATAPGGFTELDDHDDWLYGLIAHEYTHILHIDTMQGLPTIYNRIFGKTWAPNQIMPRWVIEGIATYEETKRSAGGRGRGSRFDQYLRIAEAGGEDLRLDEVGGAPRRFPGGNAPYVYGSHFLRYVFDRFGDDTVRKMSHASGRYPVPFGVNRQIAKVVGRPFTELYADWKAYLRDRYSLQRAAAERRGLVEGRQLTRTAQTNLWPRYSADGTELWWLASDGYEPARLRAMPVGGDAASARDVVEIDGLGAYDVLDDGSLVFEQGRIYRGEYAYQDLMRWDRATGQITRLSTGRRARDPSVSPDGRRVAFSMNERSESVLAIQATTPDAPAQVVWRGARHDQVYQPAWSPDGERIAFSAWRTGGWRDILIVEASSGQVVEEVTRDRAVDMAPAWTRDGRYLLFDSDRTGISNIYAYDTRERTTWQVTNVLGGAFAATASPDGTRLAFQAAVPAGGYDVFELPLDRSAWLPAQDFVDDKPQPVVIRDGETEVSAPRPYRAIETLAPQSWTGTFNTGASTTASLSTGGSDAVGLHTYILSLSTDSAVGALNIGAAYAYSGLRPGFRISAGRSLAERTARIDGRAAIYTEESWAGTLSLGIPFESRPGISWTFQVDYDLDWFRLVVPPRFTPDPNHRLPVLPVSDYVQAGINTRVSVSNVKSTVYGYGPQSGWDIAVNLRIDHPLLGATYRNATVSYGFDAFQRLWGTTPVLAVRAVGAVRAGDQVRGPGFALGGVPPQDIVNSIVRSTRTGFSGYLRGYPARVISGNHYHLLNLEYRQELIHIERGLATLPFYLRRLNLGVLVDTGVAFDGKFDLERHARTSLGAALRLDALFGHYVPGTFEIGYARGLAGDGIHETWFLLTGSI